MIKKILFLYILVLLIIYSIIPMSFAGTETASAYKIISLRIDGATENIFYDNEYNVNESLTVLDAIEQAVGRDNITTLNSYHGDKYISKINNEEETILSSGEYAGWQYRVNDVEPCETIDKYIVADNDRIVVYYGTLNTEYPKDDSTEISEETEKKLISNDYELITQKKDFEDIDDKRVDLLVSMGVVTGEPDNKFYPENNITRAEVIALLAKLSREEIKTNNEKLFSDTPVNEWYFDIVMWGYNKGIITGYENYFEPDEYITREDLAVIVAKYLERVEGYEFRDLECQFDDVNDMYDYSKSAIANLADIKLVNGKPNNRFDPKGFATRYETVIILTNFLKMKYDDVNF